MKIKYYLQLLQSEIKCICSWLGNKSRDINNEHHGWELNNTWVIGNTTRNVVCRRHRTGSLAKGKFILAAEGLWEFRLGGRCSSERGFVISSWAVGTLPWLRCSGMCCACVLRLESSPIQDCTWQPGAWRVCGISFPLAQSLFSKARYSQEFLSKGWVPACNQSVASNNG